MNALQVDADHNDATLNTPTSCRACERPVGAPPLCQTPVELACTRPFDPVSLPYDPATNAQLEAAAQLLRRTTSPDAPIARRSFAHRAIAAYAVVMGSEASRFNAHALIGTARALDEAARVAEEMEPDTLVARQLEAEAQATYGVLITLALDAGLLTQTEIRIENLAELQSNVLLQGLVAVLADAFAGLAASTLRVAHLVGGDANIFAWFAASQLEASFNDDDRDEHVRRAGLAPEWATSPASTAAARCRRDRTRALIESYDNTASYIGSRLESFADGLRAGERPAEMRRVA